MKHTEAERQEWKGRLVTLAAKIRALTPAERETLAGAGTLTAEGHALSLFNCCYLAAQAGRLVAQVGGFRQWERVGRTVRAGEHAVGYIWVPLAPRKVVGEDAAGDERVRFRLVPVFAVEQTEAAAVAAVA